MIIRRAENKDIKDVERLLSEVLEIHAAIRPDIFISGTTKYTDEELMEIFHDDNRPVFVAEAEGEILGYAFCIFKEQPFSTNMHQFTTLFIDDLCVDNNARGKHVGKSLFEYVVSYAKSHDCYDVTLNVWAGNDSAIAFYKAMGLFEKETQMEMILK